MTSSSDDDDLSTVWVDVIKRPHGKVNVNGLVDARGIEYIGDAVEQPDGTWRCLADVGGALCIVEVKIRFGGPALV